jgi:hypothetical protein
VAWPALRSLASLMLLALLGACGSSPLQPWTAETVPLVHLPITQAGVADERGRFRKVFCAVLARESASPGARSCDDALTRLGSEPMPSGRPVAAGPIGGNLVAMIVPGIGNSQGAVVAYPEARGRIAAVVPGSTLLGCLDADHWAVAIPTSERHPTITALFVTQNAYPRLAWPDAVMSFVAEDRAAR